VKKLAIPKMVKERSLAETTYTKRCVRSWQDFMANAKKYFKGCFFSMKQHLHK